VRAAGARAARVIQPAGPCTAAQPLKALRAPVRALQSAATGREAGGLLSLGVSCAGDGAATSVQEFVGRGLSCALWVQRRGAARRCTASTATRYGEPLPARGMSGASYDTQPSVAGASVAQRLVD